MRPEHDDLVTRGELVAKLNEKKIKITDALKKRRNFVLMKTRVTIELYFIK